MYLVNYTSSDFQKNLQKSDLIIIPIGSVEAHGQHLPLGSDIFSPQLFCEMIEKKIGEMVWIAPAIPYGQSYDLSIYPGTINVPSQILSEYIFAVGKSLFENGLRKLIFLNGHGGNVNALNLASEKLMQLGLDVLTINWWLDFANEILTITSGQGHAGEDETSAILFYDDKLVQMDKAGKNSKKMRYRVYFKERGRKLFENALTGDATLASKDKGEKIFNLLTDKIIEIILDIRNNKYYVEE